MLYMNSDSYKLYTLLLYINNKIIQKNTAIYINLHNGARARAGGTCLVAVLHAASVIGCWGCATGAASVIVCW